MKRTLLIVAMLAGAAIPALGCACGGPMLWLMLGSPTGRHEGKQRANNLPVGLIAPATDPVPAI